MSPTISTKKTKEKRRGLKSRQSMEREKLIFLGIVIGCGVTVLIHLIIQIVGVTKASGSREFELNAHKSRRAIFLEEDAEKFINELEIAKKAQEENLAAQARADEYEKRLSLDPAFMKGKREEAILKMKQIEDHPEIEDMDALKMIAKLASPPKSGVGVFKDKKRGIRVEVAFPYNWITNSHQEFNNYLPGYYHEVRMTAAGIMKDVFSFGASRGVKNLTVTCQNVVTVKTRQGKKKELRDLFTVTGSPGSRDWTRMSRGGVEGTWKKKKDQFPGMLKGYR